MGITGKGFWMSVFLMIGMAACRHGTSAAESGRSDLSLESSGQDDGEIGNVTETKEEARAVCLREAASDRDECLQDCYDQSRRCNTDDLVAGLATACGRRFCDSACEAESGRAERECSRSAAATPKP